jgi:peptidoglycan/LPS O-acetylase OafA/YrhL
VIENSSQRFDFRFVDGMRGLAALAVVLLHASLFTGLDGDMARDYPGISKALFLGNYAVAVFIVLSGFVLMLPIAKSSALTFRNGVWVYFKRRAWRILPPYFASLILFGAAILCIPMLQEERGTAWDSKVPVTGDGVVAHLFLVHNVNAEWAYQINGPAWSIGTEWQLYFALPLIILPIWKRFGRTATMVATLALSAGVAVFLPSWSSGHMWFLALFTMGALSAHAVVQRKRLRKLGATLAISTSAAVLLVTVLRTPLWLIELAVGGVIALSLYWMANRSSDDRPTLAHKVLESKLAVWLGLWSFSLYLIHSPILGLTNLLLVNIDMPTLARFGIQVALAVPLAGAISYIFHLLVERRFITSHQSRTGVTGYGKQPERPMADEARTF